MDPESLSLPLEWEVDPEEWVELQPEHPILEPENDWVDD